MGTAGVDSVADIVQAMAPGTTFDEPPVDIEPEVPEGRVSEPAGPETEPPEEGQPDQKEPEPEEGGEPTEASLDDLLPAKQQKAYSDALMSRYAEKFGVDPSQLDSPGVRSLLKGKIDADILISSRDREAEVARREAEARTAAEAKPPSPPTTEYTFPQIAQMTQAIAKAHVTDEGAAYVGPLLYNSLSKYADAMESGDEGKVKEANRDLTTALMQFGVMMMAEMSPVIFAQQFHSAMDNYAASPQFREHLENYESGYDAETSLYDEALDLLAKEPGYRDVANLREQGQIDRVAEDFFRETGQELSSVPFRNRETGQPLPPLQNAIAQYRYAVRLLRGDQYQDPAEVARRGVEAGRRRERQNQNRNALGRFSTGRQSGRFEGGSGDDGEDFMKSMQDAVGREAPMSDLQFVSNLVGR